MLILITEKPNSYYKSDVEKITVGYRKLSVESHGGHLGGVGTEVQRRRSGLETTEMCDGKGCALHWLQPGASHQRIRSPTC